MPTTTATFCALLSLVTSYKRRGPKGPKEQAINFHHLEDVIAAAAWLEHP